jgi:hypothetical protein
MPEMTKDALNVLVVGGISRKAGKTSLIESILRAFSERQWTAVKVSSHLHDIPAGCRLIAPVPLMGHSAQADNSDFRLWEETVARSATDTGRFLAAGASRSLLLEADDSSLPDGVKGLLNVLTKGPEEWIIAETTRGADLLSPALFLLVAGKDEHAWKESTHRVKPFADAIVMFARGEQSGLGDSIHMAAGQILLANAPGDEGKASPPPANCGNLMAPPVFRMEEGRALPPDLRSFIERITWMRGG